MSDRKENLDEGGLPGPVRTEETEDFTLIYSEGDILQSDDFFTSYDSAPVNLRKRVRIDGKHA